MSLAPLIAALVVLVPATSAAETPAKELFGQVTAPAAAPGGPQVIGSHARGCLAGGAALPTDGPAWAAMRLGRNRAWGHPSLLRLVERLAVEARAAGEWPGLLVGDIAQPRGGPMRTGHASHQIGLDADLWLTPMPDGRPPSRAERETLSAVSMIRSGTRRADPARMGPAQAALIRRAARYPEVARIFVHPGIKDALCRAETGDRAWLNKVRPWWGHDSHFHVRLACPAGERLCRDQEPPPPGDGCGEELAWWLGDEPWQAKPAPPAAPLTLADLPAECAAVLAAP